MMEIITFETKAFKDLAEKIDRIAQFVVKKETPPKSEEGADDGWLDYWKILFKMT